jgi:N-methylhydantoinase B
VVLQPGDTFEVRCGSSGGLGDPLDRDPVAVERDVAVDRITRDEAASTYGVLLDDDGKVDLAATDTRRAELFADRLARAAAPVRAVDDAVADLADGDAVPLYPGVVQRGPVAFAERSGAPLAVAPDHWTDGCPVLETPYPERGPGAQVIVRSYLDPRSGRTLYVESVPEGEPRAFEVSPKRWTEARNR